MRLSERLAMAASERADAAAAGTTVEQWRRLRERPAGAEDPGRAGLEPPLASPLDVSVILAPQSPVTAVDPDPAADPRSICPTCGRGGEVGMVDLHARTADWSCEACGTMWRVPLTTIPEVDNLPPT